MILVETDDYLLNISNAHVIDFHNENITLYFNNENIVEMKDTDFDQSELPEYFFSYSNSERKLFFNKYSFLYLQRLEKNDELEKIRFNFYERFSFEVEVNYDQLLSQA